MTSQAKVYVAVIAFFSEDGHLFPRRLHWEDGREYSIEKILDVRPAAALKAGASKQELVETIDVAVLMGGGPAVIYGTQALAAVEELAG